MDLVPTKEKGGKMFNRMTSLLAVVGMATPVALILSANVNAANFKTTYTEIVAAALARQPHCQLLDRPTFVQFGMINDNEMSSG